MAFGTLQPRDVCLQRNLSAVQRLRGRSAVFQSIIVIRGADALDRQHAGTDRMLDGAGLAEVGPVRRQAEAGHDHAADALAVAVCHGNSYRMNNIGMK